MKAMGKNIITILIVLVLLGSNIEVDYVSFKFRWEKDSLRPAASAVSPEELKATVKELQNMADEIDTKAGYAVYIAGLYYDWLSSTEVDKGEIWFDEAKRKLVADEDFAKFMELLGLGNNIEELLGVPGGEDILGDHGSREIAENLLVSGEDIKEAIWLLKDCLSYKDKYDRVKYMAGKKFESAQWDYIREEWGKAKDLLQKLEALVPTEFCDWDDEAIRQKANEIIEGLKKDSAKAEAIADWVKRNIGFALGYGGYWNAPASETLSFSRGICFNRANLIVAMLRSIGIQARYRIMRFKKEMARGMIPPERYARMDETTEHVVAEALVDGRWVGLAGEAFTKNRWVKLEEFEAKEVGESVYEYNIDEFVRKKAKKGGRRARDRMEDYRIRKLKPLYHPDNVLKTFIKNKGCLYWNRIPAVWLESDIKVLVNELVRLCGRAKVLAELLDIDNFKKPVFITSPKRRASLEGLLGFIKRKYNLSTEFEVISKIREMAGIEKGDWDREDWQEVKEVLCSHRDEAEAKLIKKDIEEYLYTHTLEGDEEKELAKLINGGKGNKTALTAVMIASYQQFQQFVNFCREHSTEPFDPDQLIYYIQKQLYKELLLFNPEEQRPYDFIDNNLARITQTYLAEKTERESTEIEEKRVNPLQGLLALKAISESA